jgi:hypothetical protein
MVKPGTSLPDIVHRGEKHLSGRTDLAYQVSGEYAMHRAANPLAPAVILESLTANQARRRSGTDLFLQDCSCGCNRQKKGTITEVPGKLEECALTRQPSLAEDTAAATSQSSVHGVVPDACTRRGARAGNAA